MTQDELQELLSFLHDIHHNLGNLIGKKKLNYSALYCKSDIVKKLTNVYCSTLLDLSTKLIAQIEKEVK